MTPVIWERSVVTGLGRNSFLAPMWCTSVLSLTAAPMIMDSTRRIKWTVNEWQTSRKFSKLKYQTFSYYCRNLNMFIKKKLKYFTRPKQISPDLSGVSGDFRIVWNSIERKRRRSDPVLWQNPLYQQKIRKPKDNTHKRHQKLRLHNDCGPT